MSEQLKIWRDALLSDKCPEIKCGRLDMHSYLGPEMEMMKNIYVEGREDPITITGPYCDEVAFAAGDYQAVLRKLTELESESAAKDERIAKLERDRDIARGNAKWMAKHVNTRQELMPIPTLKEQTDG